MAYRIGVVGASGYGGAELLRLLAAHPGAEAAVVAARSSAGERIADVFPHLAGERRFDALDLDALAATDLVVLAAPHGAALDLVPDLLDRGARIIDLSGAFRLDAAAFAHWYGEEHPRPDLTPAVYGLTEYARDRVTAARLVANPGCYPTATLVGLLPLAGLLEPTTVVVDAISGTSGAGRGTTDALHFSHVHGDVVAYGAPTHRHTGEIEAWLAAFGGHALGPVSFTPHLAPLARGLLATAHARLLEGVSPADVQDALVDRYRGERFVHVLAPGAFPHTKAVTASNGCHVAAVVDPRTSSVTVTTAIDNLGKGAAGQALQNANRMLGLAEDAGLSAIGAYP